ncbi:MAG: DUF1569 domain-containing protein [Flavobacteriales bacterium]|nr:DUF1569 domain-containing protein [Flavobacteriales bacterium]
MEKFLVFNKSITDSIVNRLEKLNHDSKPKWGNMSAAQMLAHVTVPLEIAHGKKTQAVNPIFKFLFGKSLKPYVFGNKPYKQNLPTFKEAKMVEPQEFDAQKEKFIEYIITYQKGGRDAIIDKHPFFGNLSEEEWQIMQGKHIDHHFNQFGI